MNVATRRGFIKSASTAALAATATPALAFKGPITETPEPDPIRKWLDQWREAQAAWAAAPEDTEESARLWSEHERLEDLICNTEAKSASGLAAQLEFLVEESADYWGCESHRLAASNAMKAASRMTGGIA